MGVVDYSKLPIDSDKATNRQNVRTTERKNKLKN